jgi:hypothetical protein
MGEKIMGCQERIFNEEQRFQLWKIYGNKLPALMDGFKVCGLPVVYNNLCQNHYIERYRPEK